MNLKGKTAIVTGASRGIGKAIALGLAREGAQVVLAARSAVPREGGIEGSIQETAAAIEAGGGKALPVQCDVTQEESVQAMVQAGLGAFGTIDILVNNAGVAFFYPDHRNAAQTVEHGIRGESRPVPFYAPEPCCRP